MPNQVLSSDGTVIRWLSTGSGPSLVLVHGGTGHPSNLAPLATHLASAVTCVAIGRRGYGFSDDGADYSFEREYDDIRAVLDEVGPPRWLWGSSSGAIVALGAALVTDVEKLIVVEPPLPVDGSLFGEHLAAMEAAVGRGDLETALVTGLREGVKFPPAGIEARRAQPGWSDLVSRTPAWVRESGCIEKLPPDLERYRAISADTLLRWGTETQTHHQRAIEELERVLPISRTFAIEGHGHMSSFTAPAESAAAILEFLREGAVL
jgi:pimeloyl-ACP methyl ester carboxylesterase